jgi:hypothetical protein
VSGFCSAALPLVADHGRRHGVEIAERATRHRFRSAFLWGFMLFRDGNFIRWIFDPIGEGVGVIFFTCVRFASA